DLRRTAALPRHRRHRLHRRPAGARTAGRRAPGAGHDPFPRADPGPPVVRSGGGGARRRRRSRAGRRGVRGRRRRVLPDPRAGIRARVRGDRPPDGAGDGRRRARGRCRAPRLPRRARAAGRGPLPAPALAHRGGRDPAGLGRPDRRAARRSGARLRLGVLRDAAVPDRAAAGHGHATLGAQPHPADRRPGRAALPGRLRAAAGHGAPGLRHRRARRHELRRDDAALRRGRRPAATADPPGPAVLPVPVEPLGRVDHARAGGHRPAAGGVVAQHGRLSGARHRAVRPRSAGGSARFRRRRAPGHRPRAQLHRGHPVVGRLHARCAVGPAALRSRLGRRQPLPRRTVPADDRRPRGAVAGRRGDRRGRRLVLLPAGLAGARLARPGGGRRRPAPGTAGPREALRRRRPGLLAGRGARPGTAAAAARGDAPPRPGLAGVPRGTPPRRRGPRRRGPRRSAAAAGDVRAARARRASLLVGGGRLPRHRVRRDGARHHPRRRAVHL
ncbi:MAG: Putative nucleoside-diphosphate-sugar epimerase, partial [uncultured Blastococcus sp.]